MPDLSRTLSHPQETGDSPQSLKPAPVTGQTKTF
jgi:hypothetical protein